MTNKTPLSITTPGLVITADINNSTTVSNIPSTAMLVGGMRITGQGIPAGTYITRVKDGTSILISAATTGGAISGAKLGCWLEDTTPVTEIGLLTTGLVGQPLVPQHTPAAANFTAMAPGTIYGCGWLLRRGQVVSGVGLSMSTKAVGTPPLIKFGLLDRMGKVLVLTADVGGDAQWTATANVLLRFAFTAPFTVLYDGLYRVAGLQSVSWSGGGFVNPLCSRQSSNTPTSSAAAVSGGEPTYVTQTGQADFAAVGSSQTLTADAVGLQIILWPLG